MENKIRQIQEIYSRLARLEDEVEHNRLSNQPFEHLYEEMGHLRELLKQIMNEVSATQN